MEQLPHNRKKGEFTTQEIYSQPEAWRDAIELIVKAKESIRSLVGQNTYEQIIFTGCGSTYYLSLSAAAVFRQLTGRMAIAYPASEIWLYPTSSYPSRGKKLLMAVSRSGATTETLNACKAFRESQGGDVLTLSCYEDQPLAKMGDLNLIFPSGKEQSIAQTRAFTTLYLATIAIAAISCENDDVLTNLKASPGVCSQLLTKYSDLMQSLATDTRYDRYYFLGSGINYGLACELSLKMKEMSQSHSEPFHFFEFRHGPKSMANASTLIVGLHSHDNFSRESDVIRDMRDLGAQSITIGIGNGQPDISLPASLDSYTASLLSLPLGQVLALNHSLAKGLDPDLPHNLDAVVHIPG